jgi:hypothetical protein
VAIHGHSPRAAFGLRSEPAPDSIRGRTGLKSASFPHAPLRCEAGLQEGSLRHDCALYFRDMAVTAIIFLPIWSLLYLLQVFVSH